MVVLQAEGTKESLEKIILRAATYDAVRKITVTPIQATRKECMAVQKQKKARLVNDETSLRNPDSISGIYLTATKVAQCRLVAENRREKEEAKKETEKKTFTRKLHLQQKRYEDFQKCQDSMNSLSSSTTK